MKIPELQSEYVEARNKAATCNHNLKLMRVLISETEPTKMDKKRLWQKLFCEECGAIKYAYVNGKGMYKSTIAGQKKNGSPWVKV